MNKPYVILSAAMSIDGRIATLENDSSLSTTNDWKRVHQLRNQIDAICVGGNTIVKDNPSLIVKKKYIENQPISHPIRVIITSTGNIPMNSCVINSASHFKTIIATTSQISPSVETLLIEKSCIIIKCNQDGLVDLKMLLDKLVTEFDIKTLMLEGGARVNFSFIKNSLIDELQLSIAPVIAGQGPSLFNDPFGFTNFSDSPLFDLVSLDRLDDMILIKYKLNYNKKRRI